MKDQESLSPAREEFFSQPDRLFSAFREYFRDASLGTFVRGIVHNLNGSLQVLSMQIELLRRTGMKDETTKGTPSCAKLEKCMDQIEKMKAMLETLMRRGAASEEEAPQKIHLNDLLEDELLFLNNDLFFKHHVEVKKTLRSGLPLLAGSYVDLRVGLSNLLLNAIEAMEDAPEKKLTVTTETGDGEIRVMIGDTGDGIPEEVKPRLFKPFVTTKGGKHIGLGLFMARELLASYGASFHFTSRRGETIFSIRFPVSG